MEARIADLEARLNQSSSNSSKPPSSDGPQVKAAPTQKATGKRRGGQPGHPKQARPDLPPDTVLELRPEVCAGCSGALAGTDPEPIRHQVLELPAVRPQVTEYRRHRLTCPRCARVTCPPLPPGVRGGYGPRTQAACAVLTGAYRLGKRGVARVLRDLFGVPISPGAVCHLQDRTAGAREPVTTAVHAHLTGRPANVDETGWREGRSRAWLWVAVADRLTGFVIRRSRARKVLGELIPGTPGVLTTDRYSVYDHLSPDRRQVCWAHLRRDFQAMIDRGNDGSPIGTALLASADALLGAWPRVRDGTLSRARFVSHHLGGVRAAVYAQLGRGRTCGCAITAGVCRELLRFGGALYTFARVDGVEPTNNAAERALRHAVCWRKTSYGTDSARGSRFVERVLTVVASCQQQGRNVLTFLTDAIQAARNGTPVPSLLPAPIATP
ncbi:Transposase IS66 family protein [Gemmata obscuriglobus]|nr:Transposase IS66 family protein [Gemmata obscuriglobus]VTS09017.1 Transposase IS66 family OS=Singulisphaera acidiphila (strain ATCC BAA-1392 / DSM 18658 / VKM B-2454 / MOB10) GN=Sinac_6249 PE=4 SV=1: zf-IS66: DDE_Tnp_IS66 [Gemmata obscuriglobus UQM 2246]